MQVHPLEDLNVRYRITGKRAYFPTAYDSSSMTQMTIPFAPPSVLLGLVERVYWKPEFKTHIQKIRICSPIKYAEVNNRLPFNKVISKTIASYEKHQSIKSKIQILLDVEYVVDVLYENISPSITSADTHLGIIKDVCKTKNYHSTPALGCDSFVANVSLATGFETVEDINIDVENLLHHYHYDSPDTSTPVLFNAHVRHGVLDTVI